MILKVPLRLPDILGSKHLGPRERLSFLQSVLYVLGRKLTNNINTVYFCIQILGFGVKDGMGWIVNFKGFLSTNSISLFQIPYKGLAVYLDPSVHNVLMIISKPISSHLYSILPPHRSMLNN